MNSRTALVFLTTPAIDFFKMFMLGKPHHPDAEACPSQGQVHSVFSRLRPGARADAHWGCSSATPALHRDALP